MWPSCKHEYQVQNSAVERTDNTDFGHDVNGAYTEHRQLGVSKVTESSRCKHKHFCTHDETEINSMLQCLGLQLSDEMIVEYHV